MSNRGKAVAILLSRRFYLGSETTTHCVLHPIMLSRNTSAFYNPYNASYCIQKKINVYQRF